MQSAIRRRQVIDECLAEIGRNMTGPEYDGRTLRDVARLLKSIGDAEPITRIEPAIDYVEKVRGQAQSKAKAGVPGLASIQTPAGALQCRAVRLEWTGKRGEREAWRATFTLDGRPMTYADLRFIGLVRKRPRRTKAQMAAQNNNIDY